MKGVITVTYFRIYFTRIDVYQKGQLIHTYDREEEGDTQYAIIRAADVVSMMRYDNSLEGVIIISRNDLTVVYRTYETMVDGIQLYLSSRNTTGDTLDSITKDYHDRYIEIIDSEDDDDENKPVFHIINRLLTEEDIQL